MVLCCSGTSCQKTSQNSVFACFVAKIITFVCKSLGNIISEYFIKIQLFEYFLCFYWISSQLVRLSSWILFWNTWDVGSSPVEEHQTVWVAWWEMVPKIAVALKRWLDNPANYRDIQEWFTPRFWLATVQNLVVQ